MSEGGATRARETTPRPIEAGRGRPSALPEPKPAASPFHLSGQRVELIEGETGRRLHLPSLKDVPSLQRRERKGLIRRPCRIAHSTNDFRVWVWARLIVVGHQSVLPTYRDSSRTATNRSRRLASRVLEEERGGLNRMRRPGGGLEQIGEEIPVGVAG